MTSSVEPGATYVYGIVAAEHPCDLERVEGVGDPAQPVHRLECGGVAAVVSAAPPDLRAKRRDVLAHQRVLDQVAAQGTVLPMRFGVIARDEQSLRTELREDSDAHLETLAELEGRVEFNVKVFSDEDELIREVASSDATVRRLRSQPATAVEDRIQLGEAVAAAIDARQQSIGQHVLDVLAPLASRGVIGPPVKGAALNAGFLVDVAEAEEFVEVVDELDAELAPDVHLQRTGPLPPYSFVSKQEGRGTWAS